MYVNRALKGPTITFNTIYYKHLAAISVWKKGKSISQLRGTAYNFTIELRTDLLTSPFAMTWIKMRGKAVYGHAYDFRIFTLKGCIVL